MRSISRLFQNNRKFIHYHYYYYVHTEHQRPCRLLNSRDEAKAQRQSRTAGNSLVRGPSPRLLGTHATPCGDAH